MIGADFRAKENHSVHIIIPVGLRANGIKRKE
jgi:hypothetical protein